MCEFISLHWLTILSDNVSMLVGMWSWLVLRNRSPCVNSSLLTVLLYYQTMSEYMLVYDHDLSSKIKALVWTHPTSQAYYYYQTKIHAHNVKQGITHNFQTLIRCELLRNEYSWSLDATAHIQCLRIWGKVRHFFPGGATRMSRGVSGSSENSRN